MSTRPIALSLIEEDDDEPIDLVALQADDELINALASGLTVAAGDGLGAATDDTVSAILAAWKAEVDTEPIPGLVDTDTAMATLAAARRPSGRARHLVPVAAAAAAAVTLLGGVSLGSYSAQPDDVLWPVSKVLYSERAESVMAADRAEEHIARAKRAIASGDPGVAEKELQAAAGELAVVRPEEGRIELVAVQDFLQAKAGETTPGVPTDPGAPLAADQARKVPAGAEITSPSARTPEQPSPSESSSQEPGSSGATSVDNTQPSPQESVDPRIAQLRPAAPAPAPAEAPEVSNETTAVSPPPAPEPNPGESAEAPAPEPEQDPKSPAEGDGASAPSGEDGQTIGATAADPGTASDSGTTASSPTS